MRKTPLRKIGATGKSNIEANRLIRAQNPPRHCEVKLEGCLGGIFLTIAHRKRRAEYASDVNLLADKKNWVVACVKCHQEMDRRTPEANKLTEEVFARCRQEV